ncbi:hypothetical protein HDU98_000574, partial [Podochytrium sp. JEL0797]
MQIGEYKLKPLDAVLFSGLRTDPVANLIKKIELHETVPRLVQPFHELWTHAGIIVDKSCLPLDCLEEGKLYLYESVLSGQVAGMTYSLPLPVDHPTKKGSFHLGPQIRDFAAVLSMGDADVGICPIAPTERAHLESRLKTNPTLLLDLYNNYRDFGYPMSNLPQLASASTALHEDLTYFHDSVASFFPHPDKKTSVFCSELVSIIYKEVGFQSFATVSPDTFTPLTVEVAPEFGGVVYFAKEDKVTLLKDGTTLSANPIVTRAHKVIKSLRLHDHWVPMSPSGGVPAGAHEVGADIDGVKLYCARVKVGSAFRLGKIRADSKSPLINYFGREIPIMYGHEVLASLNDTVWVDAE